jgi:hypothetical protein
MGIVNVVPVILMDDARELIRDWHYRNAFTMGAFTVDQIIEREYDGGIKAFVNDFS